MRIRIILSVMVLACVSLFTGAAMLHEFYISLTELHYNAESSRLEVSMRIFPDDLDRALFELYGMETHLGTSLEAAQADSVVDLYLRMHFLVVADGAQVPFSYLGKEPESDAIWCYLESAPVGPPHTLKIRNSILTEQFEDQVNIVQVYAGEWNRGLLFTRDAPESVLKMGE
jgi:hypothetical protein